MNNQSIFTRAGVFCCRIIAVILFAATAGASLNSAYAANNAPPHFLTYQGYLADGNGAPLGAATPINYPVVFRIYDSQSGGNLIWAEVQTVTVDKGQFSVVLGEGADNGTEPRPPLGTLFGSASASDRFLDMTATIGGNVLNIVPRLRFLPSPYSFLATQANELVSPTGATLISSTANGDINITGSITTAGSIANSATTATPGNFGNTIVMRDGASNFQAANVSLSATLNAQHANVTSLRASGRFGGHLQGAHLEWNYSSQGKTYLLNQKGGGIGGIVFGEVDAGAGITERMRIAHDGRVGIGTSVPNANLVVNSVAGSSQVAIDAPPGQATQIYFREAGALKSAISYIPATARTHFFNNGIDGMIMDHVGGLGVGGVAPTGTLQVNGTAASRRGGGTAIFIATDVNGGAFPSHIQHGGNGDWWVRSASAGGKVILQDTGGRVGVGTPSPTALLEVRSNAGNVGNGTAVFAASHIRGGDTASHVHFGPTGDWYIRSADHGGKVILQDTGGNVVVGPGTPTLGKLVVHGAGTHTIGSHYTFYINSVTGPHNGSFTLNDVSIFASNGIHANFVRVFSDARIKNIQGRSNAENDLRTLEQIEITDYTHKDFIENGTRSIKKVIGQQLEEVYPQSVAMSVGVIPDIYVKAPIKNGWVTLATDLKKGDRVRLISDSSDQIYDILEATPSGFRTEFETVNDDVFVFGREVDDFRVVDYEAIAMLNVSATQELARQVSALKKSEARIAELEKKASRVESLEGQVAELKELVARIVDKDSKVREVAVRNGDSVRN